MLESKDRYLVFHSTVIAVNYYEDDIAARGMTLSFNELQQIAFELSSPHVETPKGKEKELLEAEFETRLLQIREHLNMGD